MSDQRFAYSDNGVKMMADYLQSEILKNSEKYKYKANLIPVIFLAGAPGAGKTEWIESFPDIENFVVLDTDVYRSLFQGYNGSNASQFHQFASRVMDRMYSFCIKNDFNMIVDGTFSNAQKVEENIAQCKKKGIAFSIILVFQDPVISYLYTKKREQEKLRNVPTDAFIDKFCNSIKTVREVFSIHPDALIFITKKLKSNPKYTDIQVKSLEQFDNLTNYEYNIDGLKKVIEIIDYGYRKNSNYLSRIFRSLKS